MPDRPTEKPLEQDNALWGHKWGFRDTEFRLNEDGSVTLTGQRYNLSGYRMYDLLPYVEKVLGVRLDLRDRKQETDPKTVPPCKRNEEFCQALEKHFKPGQYSFEDGSRLLHSHGQTTSEEVYKVLYSRLDRVVDMVFHCESKDDVRRIIQLAAEHGVCLIPFGGGTSVSGALQLPKTETRMIISVDTRRMNNIEWIDEENQCASVQAGITGMELEKQLASKGFTCGHEPDSIELSTLGGWIATNASGMKKNRYGNIEQIVENITLVTPQGVIEQVQATPRTSMGMQPQNLLFGNEGNLGLITNAVIKVHKTPDVKKYGSLVFPNFELGVEFLRLLAHSGFVPASIRLVDNTQFLFGQALKPKTDGLKSVLAKIKKFYLLNIRGFDPEKMVAATIVMEGSQAEVAYQERSIHSLAKRFKGLSAGAENGRQGYMLTYAIAYIRDFLSDFHIIGETLETSAPWSRIQQVCRAAEQRLEEEHRTLNLPGKPYISYRVTQVYHTGVCIYFMLGLYTKGVTKPEEVFARIEHSLRQAIIENGGSISHHHGVGKIRKDFMKDTLSPSSIEMLKTVKRSNDPRNIFGIRNNVFADDN